MNTLKQKGFMITEVLIVLVLIAILALMLMPSFSAYLLKSHREDAIKTILHLNVAEEKYRTTNTTYGTLANLGASTSSTDGYYTLNITNTSATTFTIVATTTGAQTSDNSDCTSFTLAYASGTATKSSSPSTDCWIK